MGPAMDALYCCCMCLGNDSQPSLVRLLIPSIQVSAALCTRSGLHNGVRSSWPAVLLSLCPAAKPSTACCHKQQRWQRSSRDQHRPGAPFA